MNPQPIQVHIQYIVSDADPRAKKDCNKDDFNDGVICEIHKEILYAQELIVWINRFDGTVKTEFGQDYYKQYSYICYTLQEDRENEQFEKDVYLFSYENLQKERKEYEQRISTD